MHRLSLRPPAAPHRTIAHPSAKPTPRSTNALLLAPAGPRSITGGICRGSALLSAAALTDSGVARLVDWANSSGAATDNVAPAAFDGLRGLMATGELKEDDTIISLPRTAAITLTPTAKFPDTAFCSPEFWGKAPWYVKLGIKLLKEKSLGAESTFREYVAQLPRNPDTPVTWEEEQLQQLQYPNLIQQVKEQRQSWDSWLQQLQASTPTCPITPADWFWALGCVRSRTFSGPYIGSTIQDRIRLAALVGTLVVVNSAVLGGSLQDGLGAAVAVFVFNILYEVILSQRLKQYALCPVVDLLNHSSTVKSEVAYDYFLDRYSVTASRPYRKGEQVLVTYGAQSNDSLMQYYGFAEAGNPFDGYRMTNLLKWLEQKAPGASRQDRLSALSDAGLLKSLQEVWIQRAGFPPATLQALRYLLADNAAAQQPLDSFLSASSPDVEQRLAGVLAHACRQELDSMGSSLEDDEKLLKGRKELGERLRAAVAFRVEKKKVLRSCLEGLQG